MKNVHHNSKPYQCAKCVPITTVCTITGFMRIISIAHDLCTAGSAVMLLTTDFGWTITYVPILIRPSMPANAVLSSWALRRNYEPMNKDTMTTGSISVKHVSTSLHPNCHFCFTFMANMELGLFVINATKDLILQFRSAGIRRSADRSSALRISLHAHWTFFWLNVDGRKGIPF